MCEHESENTHRSLKNRTKVLLKYHGSGVSVKSKFSRAKCIRNSKNFNFNQFHCLHKRLMQFMLVDPLGVGV